MESEIELLISKYWEGETTIEEEKLIHAYFRNNPSLSPEGKYFGAISKQKKISFDVNWKPSSSYQKWSMAASISVGIMVAYFVFQDAKDKQPFAVEDPREALEITRNALMMVSTGLNEGKSYSLELDKLNKAKKTLKED